MQPFQKDQVRNIICHECKPLHESIINGVLQLLDDPATQKSHLFNGRYENIYISEQQLPSISPILKTILDEGAKLLNDKPENLKIGFWFNFMQKDDVTIAHSHDDDDELLSGTYYLQMPEESGALQLYFSPDNIVTIAPEDAALTFFNPAVKHEVTQHHSPIPRISIGFNIGLKQDALQD